MIEGQSFQFNLVQLIKVHAFFPKGNQTEDLVYKILTGNYEQVGPLTNNQDALCKIAVCKLKSGYKKQFIIFSISHIHRG